MGKSKKVKVSKGETSQPKLGLAEQIECERTARPKSKQKIRLRTDEEEEVSLFFVALELSCLCPTSIK